MSGLPPIADIAVVAVDPRLHEGGSIWMSPRAVVHLAQDERGVASEFLGGVKDTEGAFSTESGLRGGIPFN